MNVVTIAPLALILNPATKPRAKQYHWHAVPGTTPAIALCICEFADSAAEDEWVGRAAVFSLGEIMASQTLGQSLINALRPLGALDGDSPLLFLGRLRQQWPMARPWWY